VPSNSSGLGLPLQLHSREVSRVDHKWDTGCFVKAARLHEQPSQHVKISVYNSIRHRVNSSATNVPRLQLSRVRCGLFGRKGCVLSGDNVYGVLSITKTPQLNVRVFKIAQIVKIPIRTRLMSAFYIGLRYLPTPQVCRR